MNIKDYALCIFIMAIWGVNFSMVKLGLTGIDPMLLTGLRFTLAVIPAIFFVKKPDVHIFYLIGYGLTFGVGVWGLSTWSIATGLSPGMAALLLQTNVIFGLFLGWFLLKESVTPSRLIGSLISLSGLAVGLMVTDGSVNAQGVVLILVAAFAWSISGILIKKSNTKNAFAFSLWSMLFAPIPLFLISYLQVGTSAFTTLLENLTGMGIFSILYQAYATTLFGYWIWNRMIVSYPLSQVAPFTLLVPIFAILGSNILFQEAISLQKVLGCALITFGLLIGSFSAKRVRSFLQRIM
jgi:drug/metabolite transporter (DMT)-like permease